MLPTGFRTFHFVSFLYVFFSFLFFFFCFVSFLTILFSFFCVSFFSVSFRCFSPCFLFVFFFPFLFVFSVSQFTGTLYKSSWLAEQPVEVRFPVSVLRFQRLVISFQVAIWLKYRWSDVNPQNKTTNQQKIVPTFILFEYFMVRRRIDKYVMGIATPLSSKGSFSAIFMTASRPKFGPSGCKTTHQRLHPFQNY